MKNSQKGFAIPLLIAIIAILIIGGGVYLYTNKKSSSVDIAVIPAPSDNSQNTQPTTPPSNNTAPQNAPAPASSSSGSPITIVSPNGGEKFVKGKTYKVTWKTSTSFNSGYPQVSITLITAKGQQAVTPDQQIITNNTGSFNWTVPTVQLSSYIQDYSGGPSTLRVLDDQSEFQFLIEGYPHASGRAEGPFDYTDGSFKIVSQ